jgi:hypothetical protein
MAAIIFEHKLDVAFGVIELFREVGEQIEARGLNGNFGLEFAEVLEELNDVFAHH